MEDLEQIMRRIHVLFAKCEPYGDESENRIIVPKKEVFRLLEQLNYAVVHMMDRYEGTAESRERGLAEYQRKSEKIMEQARAGADDVYAASLIYTDGMIEELEAVISDAKESLWAEYARMAGRLEEQESILNENQEEIKQQLNSMIQGEKYLRLVERENARLKRLEAAGAEDVGDEYPEEEDDWEEESASADTGYEYDSADEVYYKEDILSADENNQKEPGPGDGEDTSSRKEKAPSEKGAAPEKPRGGNKRTRTGKKAKKRPGVPDLEAEWAAEEQAKPVRKVGTAVYQEVGQSYDTPVKKVSYEVRVNQAYFDQLGEGNVDLDAEYYRWKEEQAKAEAGEQEGGHPEEASQKENDGKLWDGLLGHKKNKKGRRGKPDKR